MEPFLTDESALRRLVAQFEAGVLPLDQWHHRAHLCICTYYLLTDNFPLTRLRYGISHYNESQGGVNGPDSGYHETLTRFWLDRVSEWMHKLPEGSALDYARGVVWAYGDQKNLWRQVYGEFDVVRSREARQRWISPEEAAMVSSLSIS